MPGDQCAVDDPTVAFEAGLSSLCVRFARFPWPDAYLTELHGTASPSPCTRIATPGIPDATPKCSLMPMTGRLVCARSSDARSTRHRHVRHDCGTLLGRPRT